MLVLSVNIRTGIEVTYCCLGEGGMGGGFNQNISEPAHTHSYRPARLGPKGVV